MLSKNATIPSDISLSIKFRNFNDLISIMFKLFILLFDKSNISNLLK